MTRRTLSETNSKAAIRTRDLRVGFNGSEILAGVEAEFTHLGINALIGPNGAGKTTLIRALLGLTPYRGTVEFRPRANGKLPRLGYVPQRLDFDRGSPVRVRDLLCADTRWPLFLGRTKRAHQNAVEKLRLVGAEKLVDAALGRLSGGELQRVMVALAMLADPDILLLDEPVAGVDVAGAELFCDLLVKLRDQAGVTIVLVSHEMSIVIQHTDHVVCLNERVVQCQGDTLVTLTSDNIRRVFGYHAAIYEHGHEHSDACAAGEHHHPHVSGGGKPT